jgi:hypothetical protein
MKQIIINTDKVQKITTVTGAQHFSSIIIIIIIIIITTTITGDLHNRITLSAITNLKTDHALPNLLLQTVCLLLF